MSWLDKYQQVKDLLDAHPPFRTIAGAARFLRQKGAPHLCSWVQRMPSHWRSFCVEQLRPYVSPPSRAQFKFKPLTPEQVDLVWGLKLPLDPLAGLPYRVVPCVDGEVISQLRWWRVVNRLHDSHFDPIGMRRITTEPLQRSPRSRRFGVPFGYRTAATEIVHRHDAAERHAQQHGLLVPERRSMFPVGGTAYTMLIEDALRKAHIWQSQHTISDAQLLLSAPHCRKQQWHLDFATHPYRRAIPYSCLVTLDNTSDSKLHVVNTKHCPPREEVMCVRCLLSMIMFAAALTDHTSNSSFAPCSVCTT